MRIPDVVPALGRRTRSRAGRPSALDAADGRTPRRVVVSPEMLGGILRCLRADVTRASEDTDVLDMQGSSG